MDALDKKLFDVELRLLSRTEIHSDDKWYVESYKVYMNLVWLSGEVGTGAGDVAGGAEFRPTDASLGVLAMLEGRSPRRRRRTIASCATMSRRSTRRWRARPRSYPDRPRFKGSEPLIEPDQGL